ncbi:hypothetical protein WJX73_003133 [Symbiochloris irregularis]|uniref:Anaphase-promoting complex subunit 2 n=1 Tax=Symbiochloris irregularis TaxID=706552 RepID=A0AAW1NT79_9CHLO
MAAGVDGRAVAAAWLGFTRCIETQVAQMQRAPTGANFAQRLARECDTTPDCLRGIEAIAATVVRPSQALFQDASQLAQFGLGELAMHHLHTNLQGLFNSTWLDSFWAPLQNAHLHDIDQEAASSGLLSLLVSQLQILVLQACMASTLMTFLQQELQSTVTQGTGAALANTANFAKHVGPLLMTSAPSPSFLRGVLSEIYAGALRKRAMASQECKGEDSRMHDLSNSADENTFIPEDGDASDDDSPPVTRPTSLRHQTPQAIAPELKVMDSAFFLDTWQSLMIPPYESGQQKGRSKKQPAFVKGQMSDGVRIFTLPDVSYADQDMTREHFWQLACLSACMRHLDLQDIAVEACAREVFSATEASVSTRLSSRTSLHQACLPAELTSIRTLMLPVLMALLAKQGPVDGVRRTVKDQQQYRQQMSDWEDRLTMYVYELVGRKRIAQFFDAVVEHPDSLPAIQDLTECLAHTNLASDFARRFGQAMQDRLLHAGAATVDILQQYISAIRALKAMDPSRGLVEAVGAPIQGYLRSRTDAIRCIVNSLTNPEGVEGEEGGLTLAEELARSPDRQGESGTVVGEGDEAAVVAYETWEPDPLPSSGALYEDPAEATQNSDILSTLISIYGTKELFINEYRRMLGDKLLAKRGYECGGEIRTLELLKLRFGDTNLHPCEVMLKDMADSKRLNANIQNLSSTSMHTPSRGRKKHQVDISHLSATVASGLFWPSLGTQSEEADVKLHPKMQEKLETYASKYYLLKSPRKLQWQPQLGTVHFTLTVGAVTRDFTVPPVLVTILMHLQDKSEWRASKLAAKMGMTQEALRTRMAYWLANGVVTDSKASRGELMYRAAEVLGAEDKAAMGSSALPAGADAFGAGASMEVQIKQEMAVYEQFILAMLTNHTGGLSLARIHNMLKMYVSEPPYDKTAQQLEGFLQQLVGEDKLSATNDIYSKRAQW